MDDGTVCVCVCVCVCVRARYFSMETPEEINATTMNCFTCSSGICNEMFFATRYEHAMAEPAKSTADLLFTFPFLKCAVLTATFVSTVA